MTKRLKFAPTREEVDAMLQVCIRKTNEAKTHKRKREWKLNYLITRILFETGIRLSELIGQDPKIAFCRCVRCRVWRLHQQGKDIPAIVEEVSGPKSNVGSHQVEDMIEKATKYGEDVRKPLPGIYVKDIDFKRNCVIIYGKGWASSRHEPEEQRIPPKLLRLIRSYISSRQLKPDDKLVPYGSSPSAAARYIERMIRNVAVEAQIGNATLMSPHKFRAFFGTEIEAAQGLVSAQRAMRHRRAETTAGYIDIRKEKLGKMIDAVLEGDEEEESS